MTQDKSLTPIEQETEERTPYNSECNRIKNAEPDLFDPSKPRIGRRESEPHSIEDTYLFDVLKTNFPTGRALWDLHHYFEINDLEIDIEFDISFFPEWNLQETLSSYKAKDFEYRIPTLAINILSKSTWRTDFSENVDICRALGIPLYIVFSPYYVTSVIYRPPFLRVYLLQEDGSYRQIDLRQVTLKEGGEINIENVVDLEQKVPFQIGLMELNQRHRGGEARYRMILIKPEEMQILPNMQEKLEQIIADKDQLIANKDQLIADLQHQLNEKGNSP